MLFVPVFCSGAVEVELVFLFVFFFFEVFRVFEEVATRIALLVQRSFE